MAFCEMYYRSEVLQKQTAANVILPEVGESPYPVLYLLHGLSDDYTIWQRRTSIERYLDRLPLIVVMPDGGRGWYTDAAEGYRYGTALADELVQRIDRTFPTRAERGGRCIAGLSMGGYGALRLALSHPDRYCAASSLSGAVGFGHEPLDPMDKPYSPEFERILGHDFVGGVNDLYHLVETVDPKIRPALHLNCGTEDFLIEPHRRFQTHLEHLKIPHEYFEHPGSHEWGYWDTHIQDALRFVMAHLSPPVKAEK